MPDIFKELRHPAILKQIKELSPIQAVQYVRKKVVCSLEEAVDFCNKIGKFVHYKGYKSKIHSKKEN